MSTHHEKFSEYLAQNEGRYTAQKKAIVDEIFNMDRHFEIDEFIDEVRRKDAHLFSRATVYRTVKQLFDAGLIQKITTLEGRVFYEQNFSSEQHDHLICNQCGKILEIKDNALGEYLENISNKLGFRSSYRSLHIYGECQKENCENMPPDVETVEVESR